MDTNNQPTPEAGGNRRGVLSDYPVLSRTVSKSGSTFVLVPLSTENSRVDMYDEGECKVIRSVYWNKFKFNRLFTLGWYTDPLLLLNHVVVVPHIGVNR